MMFIPLIAAAALTIDFQGLHVVTPWKEANDSARVWVFLPDTSGKGVAPHKAYLVLPKEAVDPRDSTPDGRWDLSGYVLSIHRKDIKDAPGQIFTTGPGREEYPWESLHWVLDLDRIAPYARLLDNPFAKGGAFAAVKLADGELVAVAPSFKRPEDAWIVQPATDYKQALTDTVRYRIDLKDAATELHLDPVPGSGKAKKRIRLLTGPGSSISAKVLHLPDHLTKGPAHARAVAGMIADQASKAKIQALSVSHLTDMGGDPLCGSMLVHIWPPKGPEPCTRCQIDVARTGAAVSR